METQTISKRAGATELWLTIKHGVTPEQLGVSRERLKALASVIRALEEAPPEIFNQANQYGTDASADARRTVRFLVTLAPGHVRDRDLPAFVYWLLGAGRTQFSPELIREILEERRNGSREASAAKLRQIATLARRGYSRRQIKAETGAHEGIIASVTQFLGCVEARTRAIPDEALRRVEEGDVDDAAFAADYRISRASARAELEAACRVLDLDPTEELAAA